MKIRLNHPDQDKDGSLDHPTMDPAAQQKYANDDETSLDVAADFPADVGNDIGQFSLGQGVTYPPSQLSEESIEADEVTAAQDGGAGPRLDDMGIDDLQDLPRSQDLAAIDELTQEIGDRPLFDRSIENLDVGDTEDDGSGSEDDDFDDDSIRLTEREDQLPDEESQVYESSIDGPGTRDLH